MKKRYIALVGATVLGLSSCTIQGFVMVEVTSSTNSLESKDTLTVSNYDEDISTVER